MVLEAVVIESNEVAEELIYQVYFPDVIWMEGAYWEARRKTDLHPRCLTKSELEKIKSEFLYRHKSPDLNQLLLKTLDLDEKLFDKE